LRDPDTVDELVCQYFEEKNRNPSATFDAVMHKLPASADRHAMERRFAFIDLLVDIRRHAATAGAGHSHAHLGR
jgi:hypothetical protein